MAFKGFNFRSSAGFVSDGSGESGVLDVDAIDYSYPYPSFSNGVTAGYVGGSGTMRPRDRNSGVDRRLAGIHYNNVSTAVQRWRIDMTTSGTKDVALAVGDPSYDTEDDFVELFDDATSKGVLVDDATGHPSGQWYDAAGTLHTSSANWASNQASVSKTFSTTILIIAIGRGAGSAGSPVISHIAYQDGAAASTFPPVPSRLNPMSTLITM